MADSKRDKDVIRKNSDVPSNVSTTPNTVDMREIGATGLKRFSGFIQEEFLHELTGWKGLQIYKEMAENDATVSAILFAIKMLCRKVKWFVESPSTLPGDQEAADFLETCMDDMSQTWIDTIDEVLSMLEYGFNVQEIVYKRRCGDVFDPSMRSKYIDGRIGWRKLSTRSQDSIYRWQFDDHGGIQGVEQLAPPHYYHVTIPVEKFLLFRTTTRKNNPEGRSVLRGAYRSWYIKKNIENIEAIGIERDLAGLPVAFVPPELLSSGANNTQKNILSEIRNIVTNIRRNDQEGIVFPSSYDMNGKLLYDLKLLSTGGQRQFDTTSIINRYDQRIAMTVLADFILLGQEKVGSWALATSKTNLFSTAIGAFLDEIAGVFNRYAIPRLFALNDFELTEYPQIKHGDLGSVDLNELGQYIQRLALSGMPIFPNADVQKHLLEVAGLPSGEAAPEAPAQEDLQVQDPMQANGNQAVTPALPVQTPSDDGKPADTTPVNGAPPVAPVTSNVAGQGNETSRAPWLRPK
jgi:hypothetical protein